MCAKKPESTVVLVAISAVMFAKYEDFLKVCLSHKVEPPIKGTSNISST